MKRKFVITALVALGIASVAWAANFVLTKTAETSGTITLSYPKQAGADGYRYYAPGTLNGNSCSGTLVSRTFDSSRTSVKFSKVPSGQYCVEAIVLTPISAGQYPASAPPPTGTYYLAPNGSDANPCSQAAPCQTFQRGYAVANPGEIVCVTPGSYGAQQISYLAGKTTPAVVIQGCGGTPSVLALNFGNGSGNMPRALTFRDMAITGGPSNKAVTYVYTGTSLAAAATDITFDNIDIAVGKATPGQAVEIIGGTLRLTIKNSRIGPICCGRDVNGGSPVGIRLGRADRPGYPVSTDTVIDHNVIKGITRLCSEWLNGYGACPSTTCPNANDLCHEDAIQVYGSDNLTITNNQIYHTGINGIFLDSTDPNTNGTIANNMIGDIMRGATCFDIDGRGIFGTWNILNNTCPAQIGDGYYISWASTMQSNGAKWNWKGNVGAIFISSTFTPSGNCFAGTSGVFTYSYNVFSTNNGGAVGCPNNTSVGEPAYVNLALAPADMMDLHLAGPVGSADNTTPPPCFVATDIDGQTRPQNLNCDAGADSRNLSSGGGAALANIWVSNATPLGSCQDSPVPVPFDQATSCGNLDAANNTCDTGDLVYVKTANPYSGESITDSNSRFGACTIEAEPGTGDIIFTGDVSLGMFGSTSGPDGPDWLTIRHVQCGSPISFQNEAELYVWSGSDNIVLDDWDCASFDVYSDGGVTIKNGDWGPCGSSSSRKCVPRVARSNVSLIGNKFHDIQCGTGSASQCDLYHTDGLAIFGGTNILISGNLFYRNDITNIRFQSCCGNTPLANITVENNVFMQPCIDAGTGPNCTDGFRGDGFDFDSSISGAIVRFNTFADQAYPQCTGPTGCGTSGSPALFVGNIFSQPDGSCSQSNTTQNYNASSPWGGGSGCGTGTNRTGPYPVMVNPSNTASPPNMRLTGAPTIADNLVASGCIATDADGKPRPPSGCDAGAYER